MKRTLSALLPCLCLMLGAVGSSQAASLGEVSEVRGLLLAAIDARDGSASARLAGPIAQKLRTETKAPANTRVLATVTTVSVFRPGCKRLRLTLAMPTHKMATINGTTEPFVMFYELNLCRDGQPPQVSRVGLGVKP